MKQSVPPWVITSIVIVIVVLIGFVAKRTFFQNPDDSPVPWEQTRAYKEQQRMRAQGTTEPQNVPQPTQPDTNAASGGQLPSSHPRGALMGGH